MNLDFIDALAIAVPPPPEAERSPIPEHAWELFESNNGFAAPADYRALFDHWGFGSWGWVADMVRFEFPFGPGGLAAEVAEETSNCIYRQRRDSDGEPDWPIWPDANGWMPIGFGPNENDVIGWFREGPDPERWAIGIWGRTVGDCHRLNMGVGEYLYRLVTSMLGTDQDEHGADRDDDVIFEARPCVPRPVADTSKRLPIAWVTTDAVGPIDATVDLEPAQTLMRETRAGDPDFRRRMLELSAQQQAQLDPSRRIIDAWRSEAAVAFIPKVHTTLLANADGEGVGPLHWSISFSYPLAREADARNAIGDLAHRLGVRITECRDSMWEPIWPELTGN